MVVHHLDNFEKFVQRNRVRVVPVDFQVKLPDVLAVLLVSVVQTLQKVRKNLLRNVVLPVYQNLTVGSPELENKQAGPLAV